MDVRGVAAAPILPHNAAQPIPRPGTYSPTAASARRPDSQRCVRRLPEGREGGRPGPPRALLGREVEEPASSGGKEALADKSLGLANG